MYLSGINKALYMKKYYFFALMLLPMFSFAQSNYKNGYVVTLKGDTLRGQVNYQEWGQNPKIIDFKTSSNAKVQQLGFDKINGFGIDGLELYQKYVVNASLDATDLAHASINGADTISKTDTVFLRVLQTGKNVTLYEYNDEIKERFYVKDNTMAVPQELVYRVYMADRDGVKTVVTKNTFRGQLIAIAANANIGGLTNEIQEANYTKPDLVKIAAKINGTIVKKGANEARFFIGGGAGLSSLKYQNSLDASQNGTSATTISPLLTIGLDDNFINSEVGCFVLRAQLSVWTANFSINSGTVQAFIPYSTSRSVNIIGATFTPQIIYNIYNTAPLKIYLGAGLDFNLCTYPTNRFTTNFTGGFPSSSQDNDPPLQSFWIAVPVKVGIMINKRIDVYAGYSASSSITSGGAFSTYIDTIQAGINFFLSK